MFYPIQALGLNLHYILQFHERFSKWDDGWLPRYPIHTIFQPYFDFARVTYSLLTDILSKHITMTQVR